MEDKTNLVPLAKFAEAVRSPAKKASADNTYVKSGETIIDSNGDEWMLGGRFASGGVQVFKNGQEFAGGGNVLAYVGGKVLLRNDSGAWFEVTKTGWVKINR